LCNRVTIAGLCERVHIFDKDNGGITLFSFLKKKARINGQIGLGIDPSGVGIARITFSTPTSPPLLSLCQYHPTHSEAERDELLARLSDEQQLDQFPCVSIAATDSFTLLLVEAPEVDPSELKAAVRWRIKDLLDFHIDDAVIDVFDIPGQQERGRPKLMYVVASRITTVQSHIDQLENQGINLSAIDIPEMAMRNIAALLPEDESGVVMLYLGRNFGLLTMTRDKNLYLARKFDIGCEQLANCLNAARGEDEFVLEEAEEMPPQLKHLLDTIVLEIQRSLDYYESHFSLPSVAGLVLVPIAHHVPGMMGYIAGNLGVPVRMLDLNALLDCEQTLSDALQSQCLLAIGAALRQENKVL